MGMLRAYWVCSVHSVHSVRCMWTRCIQCTRCAACVLGALHMYSVRCMCIRRLWFVQCTRCTWRVQSLIVSTNRSSHSHSITRLVSAKAHVHRQPLQPQSSAPRNPAGSPVALAQKGVDMAMNSCTIKSWNAPLTSDVCRCWRPSDPCCAGLRVLWVRVNAALGETIEQVLAHGGVEQDGLLSHQRLHRDTRLNMTSGILKIFAAIVGKLGTQLPYT